MERPNLAGMLNWLLNMITSNIETPATPPVLALDRRSQLRVFPGKQKTGLLKAGSRRKRILVVDDEMNIADSLTEILCDNGYDAVAFYNGDAAIDSVRTQCPDCVIVDVMMPKLNGVETVLAIRERCPATRILLFSGQAGTADILEEARANGHQFELLPKPIHPDLLLKKLASFKSS